MVVTRKVRTGKKDEPSTSAEGEDQPEKVLPDVSESEHEGQPDDIQDEDMETVENIKEELEKTTEDLGSGKRVSKPTFKVKFDVKTRDFTNSIDTGGFKSTRCTGNKHIISHFLDF